MTSNNESNFLQEHAALLLQKQPLVVSSPIPVLHSLLVEEDEQQVLHKATGVDAPLPLEGPPVLQSFHFLKSTFSLGQRSRESVP